MRIFDPHIHMTSRTTDDYAAMYAAGVRAVVEPSFWLGQPRTCPGTFYDYFDSLLGWEPFRAAQYGIAHHCTIALNPKEASDPRCLPVLDELPRYLVKDCVVAVGEIGYDSMTAAEDRRSPPSSNSPSTTACPRSSTPRTATRRAGLTRTLDVCGSPDRRRSGSCSTTSTRRRSGVARDSGCWLGFSIYPDTKMGEDRMVRILRVHGTAGSWSTRRRTGAAATRSRPAQIGDAMLAAGFTDDEVDQVLWRNPVAFYGQSGRLDLDLEPSPEPSRSRATPSCAAGNEGGRQPCASATPTAPPSTSRTAPTCTRPRTSTACSPSCADYAEPVRAGWHATGSASACGWPADAARTLTAEPAGRPCAACRTRPPRPGGGHPQRLPVPGVQARSSRRASTPDWTEPARLAYTPTARAC